MAFVGTDPAVIVGMLVGIGLLVGIGAVQVRHPAATHLDIDGDRLVVRLGGWDVLWAMKRKVSVSLVQIAHVTTADTDSVPRRGMRLPGTSLPGWIRAGTYGTGPARELWNVRRAPRILVVDLGSPEPFARIVVEVDDPDGAAERVREAVAAARTRPR